MKRNSQPLEEEGGAPSLGASCQWLDTFWLSQDAIGKLYKTYGMHNPPQ